MAVYDEKDGVNKKMQVFTPELWQFVCLIFGRVSKKSKILLTFSFILTLRYFNVHVQSLLHFHSSHFKTGCLLGFTFLHL